MQFTHTVVVSPSSTPPLKQSFAVLEKEKVHRLIPAFTYETAAACCKTSTCVCVCVFHAADACQIIVPFVAVKREEQQQLSEKEKGAASPSVPQFVFLQVHFAPTEGFTPFKRDGNGTCDLKS